MANQFNSNYQYNSPQPQVQIPQMHQLFPQPQGNVYMLNNSLEVANIPMGVGVSVAICLPEGLCYLKSLQNGTPTFMAYKLSPYTPENQKKEEEKNFEELLAIYDNRIKKLEEQLNKGGKLDELL